MGSFFDGAGPILDPDKILPALRSAEIKLVDRIEIFRSLPVELGWKRVKELFDGFGCHVGQERNRSSDASGAA